MWRLLSLCFLWTAQAEEPREAPSFSVEGEVEKVVFLTKKEWKEREKNFKTRIDRMASDFDDLQDRAIRLDRAALELGRRLDKKSQGNLSGSLEELRKDQAEMDRIIFGLNQPVWVRLITPGQKAEFLKNSKNRIKERNPAALEDMLQTAQSFIAQKQALLDQTELRLQELREKHSLGF